MMTFLGNLVWISFALTAIIMFLMISAIGLAALDYTLDSDIKGALVRLLGPRHFLKNIRIKLLKLAKRLDTPSEKDIPMGLDGTMWHPDIDYDKEIHDLIDEIEESRHD